MFGHPRYCTENDHLKLSTCIRQKSSESWCKVCEFSESICGVNLVFQNDSSIDFWWNCNVNPMKYTEIFSLINLDNCVHLYKQRQKLYIKNISITSEHFHKLLFNFISPRVNCFLITIVIYYFCLLSEWIQFLCLCESFCSKYCYLGISMVLNLLIICFVLK